MKSFITDGVTSGYDKIISECDNILSQLYEYQQYPLKMKTFCQSLLSYYTAINTAKPLLEESIENLKVNFLFDGSKQSIDVLESSSTKLDSIIVLIVETCMKVLEYCDELKNKITQFGGASI